MTKPHDPFDDDLNAEEQSLYDAFEHRLSGVKDDLWTLVDELESRHPKGFGAYSEGLVARITNDLGLLAEDIRHDLVEYAILDIESLKFKAGVLKTCVRRIAKGGTNNEGGANRSKSARRRKGRRRGGDRPPG